MKKLVLTMLFGLIALAGYSQARWDVQFGMNFSNMTKMDDSKALPGFNLGIGMDYSITDMWSFKSGVMFSSKGWKYKEDGYKDTYRPVYLEIPLMGAWKTNITDNIRWYVNAGPYLACGIFGKSSVDIGYGYESTTNVWEDGDFGFKRFDAGLTFGTGFLFHQVRVGVAYDLGLVNVISGGKMYMIYVPCCGLSLILKDILHPNL